MASKTVTRSMDHSERFWIKLRKYNYKETDWNAFNLSPVKSRIRARFLSKRLFTKFEAKIGLFIRRACKNRKNLPPWMPATIECFHSRGQHLCKFIGTKERVCIRKEFNSHRIGLGHQHGRRDVMWKHSIIIAKAVNGRKFIFRYNRGKIFAEVSERPKDRQGAGSIGDKTKY